MESEFAKLWRKLDKARAKRQAHNKKLRCKEKTMSKYNNELHKHKAADTIKWIVAFVLIIAIMGAVVCLALQVSGVFDFFKKDDASAEEIESNQDEVCLHFDIQNSAPSISPVDGIRGVSLALATTAAEDMYSKTLTATQDKRKRVSF